MGRKQQRQAGKNFLKTAEGFSGGIRINLYFHAADMQPAIKSRLVIYIFSILLFL
jgi:hypothetical protein